MALIAATIRHLRDPLNEFVNYKPFEEAIIAEIILIARTYYCTPNVAKIRVLDIWDFWRADVERNSRYGFRQTDRLSSESVEMTVDDIKQAAFLAFWIRRLQPIVECRPSVELVEGMTTDDVETIQRRFTAFANEIVALRLGLSLAAIYEKQRYGSNKVVDIQNPKRTETIDTMASAPKSQSHLKFVTGQSALKALDSWELLRDYAMVLKYKNISPYSMYLIFRSIFGEARH